jgi:deoxyxylulose-5-phosphate synthase
VLLGDSELSEGSQLGEVDKTLRGQIPKPERRERPEQRPGRAEAPSYAKDKPVATRDAYGNALDRLYAQFPRIVGLDGEVGNSTRAKEFAAAHPARFFEDHYAEGGLGEAVRSALASVDLPILLLAVRRRPRSGAPDELRDYEGIGSDAIVSVVKESIGRQPLRASL